MAMRLTAVFLLVLSAQAVAGSPASERSIRELLEVTEVRKLTEGLGAQIDQMMEQNMKEALKGRTLTAREEKTLKKMRENMVTIVKEEISWESMQAFSIRVYSEAFTQEEIDGMLAFYRSDAGRAVTRKMPMVMQASMAEMQKRMPRMMARMKELQSETMAELNQGNTPK